MNNMDIAGILRKYSEKARLAKTTKRLKETIREVKRELDLRKVKMEDAKDAN